MLFGQSVFQSVLTRLHEEEKQEEAGPASSPFRVAGLNTSFVAATVDAPSTVGPAGASAYLDYLADPGELPSSKEEDQLRAAEPVPEHLLRLSAEEIAADLGITPDDTAETLAEKRRRFAKENHPDLVPAALRDNATLRMKTANLLIDRAIKDLYWRSS